MENWEYMRRKSLRQEVDENKETTILAVTDTNMPWDRTTISLCHFKHHGTRSWLEKDN